MRIAHVVQLAAVATVAGSPLAAQAPDAPPLIRTSASASQPVPPDRVAITVSVVTKGPSPSAAGARNADLATQVRRAISALGVPADSITTLDYSVEMRVGPDGGDTAFIASNTVLVRLRRLALVGRVIDTALTVGATSLSGVSYTADSTGRAARRALAAAVAEARGNADEMARAAGGRLGRLVYLTTEPSSTGVVSRNVLEPRDAGSSVVTPIRPGSLTVTAWVEGAWEFIPARP